MKPNIDRYNGPAHMKFAMATALTAVFLAMAIIPAGPVAVAAEASLDGRWIVDAAGRRIEVVRPFERIISLYGAHTENLFAMQAGERLIGVSRHDDYPPAARHKPVFSYHDDPEKFLAANPDLVLIRPMIDRGYARLMAQLQRYGIAVVSLQPGSIEEMFTYWRALGLLCGRQARAGAMVDRFQKAIDNITRLAAALPAKKRVYFEAIHDRMRTFAPESMPIFALETAGGINVAKDAPSRRGTNIADFGKERILSLGAAIDVYLAQVGPMNRPTVATIKAEPGYELIRAVQNDHIHLIDEKLVSRPTLRLLTGIHRIGQILYPGWFGDDPLDEYGRKPHTPAALKSTNEETRQ